VTNKRAGFARQRKSCGFTQESFAQALEVDRTTVQRWERGEGSPQPHIRPKLARALKVTPAELDALLFHDLSRSKDPAVYRVAPSENGTTYAEDQDYLDVGDLDEMIRREFLRLMSIAGAAISATETQFAAGEIHELAVSGEFVSLDRMNSHLWQIFSLSSSKETVYPVVREQLCELTRRLKAAKTQGAHRQLCATAGDLFQIAGEIFFDGNRYTDAAHSYALAASASKEAGDYDLWACALTRHAFIGMYEQRFDEGFPSARCCGTRCQARRQPDVYALLGCRCKSRGVRQAWRF
jgi:transcriptional regulator with XRE-family HTH domain